MSATPELDPQLELVLRAATAEPDRAADAARAFIGGFDPDRPLDPRVYAAVPAVYARLGPAAGSDDPRWKLFSGVARQVWTRNQMRLSAARSALDTLGQVGAAPLVLPGAVTAMAALDDPGARVLERVDLLVAPDHVARVTAALLGAGATIRQDHEPLLDGRLDWQPLVYAELAHGALVVRWDHPVLDATVLDAIRDRPERLRLGPLGAATPVAADALLTVLADLTDTDPGPVDWTSLVLEAARLRRALDADGPSLDRLARAAHDVDRHDAWTDMLRFLAHVSGDRADREAADRFAAVPRPMAASGPRPHAPTLSGRARRILGRYRFEARSRAEPATVRGLARYLTVRWRLHRRRDLPREALRRLLRARRTHSVGVAAVEPSSSATLASSTSTE